MINKSASHLVLAKKLRDRIKFVPNIYSQNVLLSIVEFTRVKPLQWRIFDLTKTLQFLS